MYSAHNSNTFLAYYNQIDKYLSFVLWLDKYIPFHERITMIVRWKYPQTRYVSSQEAKIRYFWDLRNHLVHGFRLDNKHYIFVSEHALEQITGIHDELIKPQKVKNIFWSNALYVAQKDDNLNDTLAIMRSQKMNYLPVYEWEQFAWVMGFQDMIGRLLDHQQIDTKHTAIIDVNIDRDIEFAHIDQDKSIYELEDLFVSTWSEVILITHWWTKDGNLLGVVSLHELVWYDATLNKNKHKNKSKNKNGSKVVATVK